MKKKILILSPNLNYKGGVSTFNSLLLKYSKNDITIFTLNSNRKKKLIKPLFLFSDYMNFISKLIFYRFDIVHINPSLSRNAINRDSIYILISKLFKKKVFVFWHGWNIKNEYLLNSYLLKKAFFKSDHIRFLASEFRNKFVYSGFNKETSIGNTFVDDELLAYDIKREIGNNNIQILFLSRVTREKGIFVAIKAFHLVSELIPNIYLTIAGDGSDLGSAEEYVKDHQIKNIEFIGRVEDKEKVKVFKKADIYIFPSFTEGMPISLFEAMLFGNTIITSDVGGIKDFFIQDKMGYMLNNHNPKKYCESIVRLIKDRDLNKISEFNTNIINSKYLASVSVNEIDRIYSELI